MISEPFGRTHEASLRSVRCSCIGLGQCDGFLESSILKFKNAICDM